MAELFKSAEPLLEDESEVEATMMTLQQDENEVVTENDLVSLDLLQEVADFYEVMTDVTLIQTPSARRFVYHCEDAFDHNSFIHPITYSWQEMQRTITAFNYSLHLPSQMDVTLPSLDKLECQITADIHLQMQQEKLSQILPYLVGYELMYEMRLDNYLDRKTHYKLHS
jgi:hypothetical protein